ncbi:MAG TPA: response regulator transcription factor [Candidatus Dormibacteraeota bacterium]|nr:response regulator transcription factor [Candidatus Dormibacteraeota bacterium]
MRVLVVEDDSRLAELLQQGLEEDGMIVDVVRTGEEATTAAMTQSYDVISLDVMIPGQDGFAVSSELRRRKIAVPILMLTSRDQVSDRIHGLESGADDYLTKPFAFEEFLARVRALARRHLMDRSALLVAGSLRVDTIASSASVGDRQLDLTMKEYALLEFLVHNRDRLLDRGQIAEHVWGLDFPGESNLVDVYIGRLRRKLAEAGLEDAISTVRHGGYRFNSG